MVTITVDPNYGYVILAATSSFFLNTWHSLNTGQYRKAAKVTYPACYAPSSRDDLAAHQFNCAQRAHANYGEHWPAFLAGLLVGGLKYPIVSSSLGGVWLVSRVFYTRGYSQDTNTTKDKKAGTGRYAGGLGMLHSLAEVGLIFTSGYVGLGLVLGW